MSDVPGPTLFFLGVSHHRTPLALREKLALTTDKMEQFCQKLGALPGLREYAVLNTCNRVEFYGVAEGSLTAETVEQEFCAFQDFPVPDFRAIREFATGGSVVEHLLEVSSGLDSQMLGETEILGQVKTAYADAQKRRSVGPLLNRLFQKNFQHAKYIRTNTAITEGQISVANVAVDLAQKIFGKLGQTKILLLGAGDIGEKTAKAFQSRGADSLTVASRHIERAVELAQAFDARALPFEHVPHHLFEYDIVVCSTAAPTAVVRVQDTAMAMKKRRAQPLFFIDLAMPRDVEPAVGQLENVFVYNLDDLARIAEENRLAREAEVVKAKVLLRDRSAALWRQVGGAEGPNGGAFAGASAS